MLLLYRDADLSYIGAASFRILSAPVSTLWPQHNTNNKVEEEFEEEKVGDGKEGGAKKNSSCVDQY